MPLYSYAKHKPVTSAKKYIRVLSLFFIITGFFVLSWVAYPIIVFELFYAPKFGNLITPVVNKGLKDAVKTEFSQMLGISNTDFTKASMWFPKAANIKISHTTSTYTLSIPKVKIQNALVTVGGEDLSKSLIHFTGPLPGNFGNPVIFGHSTLPFLYNPTDYKTIFSKVPDLNSGDDLYVTTDNVTYHYQIYEMKIVGADDIRVLEQNYDFPNITLVTCVPPGTYFKRLIVRAKLVKI